MQRSTSVWPSCSSSSPSSPRLEPVSEPDRAGVHALSARVFCRSELPPAPGLGEAGGHAAEALRLAEDGTLTKWRALFLQCVLNPSEIAAAKTLPLPCAFAIKTKSLPGVSTTFRVWCCRLGYDTATAQWRRRAAQVAVTMDFARAFTVTCSRRRSYAAFIYCLALTSHCLSSAFYCLSLTFHCLSPETLVESAGGACLTE